MRPLSSKLSIGNGLEAEAAASGEVSLFLSINTNAKKRNTKIAPLTTQNHNRIPIESAPRRTGSLDQLDIHRKHLVHFSSATALGVD